VFCEHFDGSGEFFIQASNENQGPAFGLRIGNFELVGVEGEAFDKGFFFLELAEAVIMFELGKHEAFAGAIERVYNEGHTGGGHVDSYLVSSACQWAYGDECSGAEIGEYLPIGYRVLAVFAVVDTHEAVVSFIWADGGINSAGFLGGAASNEGQICLLGQTFAEIFAESTLGGGVACQDHNAAGVLIKAVDEQQFALVCTKLGGKGEDQFRLAGAVFCDGKPAGFIYHDNVTVGVNYANFFFVHIPSFRIKPLKYYGSLTQKGSNSYTKYGGGGGKKP